jgi:PHD-finger
MMSWPVTLQALPGAQHLMRLRTVPAPLSLPAREAVPAAERAAHMCACAATQPLPPAVAPVPLPRAATGSCDVCDRDIEFDGVRLLCCARCGVTVHNTCYDVHSHDPEEAWLCEPCGAGVKAPPACALCPIVGGAMRFCEAGEWIHAACALWIPGVLVGPGRPPSVATVRSCTRSWKLAA